MPKKAELLRLLADKKNRQKQEEDALINTRIINVVEEIQADCENHASEGLYSHNIHLMDYSHFLDETYKYETAIVERLRLEGFIVTKTSASGIEFNISWEAEAGVGL